MNRLRALQMYGLRGPYRPLSPGTLKGGWQRRPTKARSEGSLSASDARNFGEFGGANEPGRRNKPGI